MQPDVLKIDRATGRVLHATIADKQVMIPPGADAHAEVPVEAFLESEERIELPVREEAVKEDFVVRAPDAVNSAMALDEPHREIRIVVGGVVETDDVEAVMLPDEGRISPRPCFFLRQSSIFKSVGYGVANSDGVYRRRATGYLSLGSQRYERYRCC